MPENLLRRYIDDIEDPNDDVNAGIFLRRPSRAERSIDDPIREIEGMLVDEYGRYCVTQIMLFDIRSMAMLVFFLSNMLSLVLS